MHKTRRKIATPRIRKRTPPGAMPGVVPAIPDLSRQKVNLTLISYSEQHYEERHPESLKDVHVKVSETGVVWLHIEGMVDPVFLEELGARFGLHRLALEDVINSHQRPKIERYNKHSYIVLRLMQGGSLAHTDQLNIFLGDHFVVTLQEHKSDGLQPVKDRLHNKVGRIRQLGAGYLGYAIIDAVVDTYFPLLERVADRLDDLEDNILKTTYGETLAGIHEVKRDLLMMRRIVWAHRELVYGLMRDAPSQFDEETSFYLRDCYDHTMQQLDLVETYRDVGSNLMDLSFSLANSRANDVMKVLTVVSTLFIPMTFISGVYGMNFNTDSSPWNMPELNWIFGYPFALALMFTAAGTMLYFFYRKGWFS